MISVTYSLVHPGNLPRRDQVIEKALVNDAGRGDEAFWPTDVQEP